MPDTIHQLDTSLLTEMRTSTGDSIFDMSYERPVMLVFLRHFGCTFCREALAELARIKTEIESRGTTLVLVHMTDDETASKYFERYKIENPIWVNDPECRFYKGFGLVKGNFQQLFGLRSWVDGFKAFVNEGHFIGMQLGDGFQMPGVFTIHKGKVIDQFVHRVASDKPDYLRLCEC